MDTFLVWIPLLPLLGAAFNLIIGRGLARRTVHLVACALPIASFFLSVRAIAALARQAHGWHPEQVPRLVHHVYTWIATGDLTVECTLSCDPLTAVMLFIITFIGSLIHIYSAGYMDHDASYARFFGYLNLFMGSMLILVMGDSLPLLFVGWEGVGACSYLLIGFWYDKTGPKTPGLGNASAGRKAFIVNRIGDFAFLLGMFVIYSAAGTLDFTGLADASANLARPLVAGGTVTVATAAAVLLLVGATGKSAQIPLYVWLPDAMAGPTPVSALIHAATMVTAGVYMVARLNVLYMMAPFAMGLVALVGAVTAVFAASIAFAQTDIKKVLAYSTVSQLGYMFIGVGSGAFSAGLFHVFTHAFFKACLFLGAGAVIHALHDEQDIRSMGGLRKRLPVTHATFLVSTIAIAGIPPLSGFFSKDEILWKALATGNPAWPLWLPFIVYVLGMAGAVCTAFYMFRLYALTFLGTCRLPPKEAAKIHPPGFAMRLPLVMLAGGAAVAGFLGVPELLGSAIGVEHPNLFHNWLSSTLGQGATVASAHGLRPVSPNAVAHNHALELGLMILSVVVAVAGAGIAHRIYHRGPSSGINRFAAQLGGLYRLVLHKYWIDELYSALIVRPYKALSWVLFKVVDRLVIDVGSVHGVAAFCDIVGHLFRRLQSGNVQTYVAAFAVGLGIVIYSATTPPNDLTVVPGTTVSVGQHVAFDASRSVESDSQRFEYRWDFDGDGHWDQPHEDGEWSREARASFTYPRPGRYRLVMRVRDRFWKVWRQRVLSLTVKEGRR